MLTMRSDMNEIEFAQAIRSKCNDAKKEQIKQKKLLDQMSFATSDYATNIYRTNGHRRVGRQRRTYETCLQNSKPYVIQQRSISHENSSCEFSFQNLF